MTSAGALEAAVTGLAPMSLNQLNELAPFQRRVDKKYIVDVELLETVLGGLGPTHSVLEIQGRRVFEYESVYFDDADLRVFNDHRQRRRRRFKLRVRHYADSDLCFFELKLKGRRGSTVKYRLPHTADQRNVISGNAEEFADAVLRSDYDMSLEAPMTPTLITAFRRATFPGNAGTERVTVDFDLRFDSPDGYVPTAGLRTGYAIVETKSADGRGIVDGALLARGIRPVACSKYCIGMAMTRPGLRSNRWKRLIQRYFVSGPTGDTSALRPA